jgi:ectoine hydroxylase-related dioxygenase (phytanoyl-CoA dioxygenase family)
MVMPIEHLDASTTPEKLVEILQRDGCAVLDGLADAGQLERIQKEMTPFIDATATGRDEFTGSNTRRTGELIARSPATRELITHPTILAGAKGLLAKATSIHIHLTQIIAISPGESEQMIHRDQWAFDFFPFPKGYEVQCNTLWALTDFSEENGATRVIPGSNHFDDGLRFELADTEPAEMRAGSVLVYTGALYHGGGPNRSDAVRMGINLTYARGWLRQEENQYLAVPQDLARELPDDLLRLMGYAPGAYALGYVGDLRDALDVLKGRGGSGDSFGDGREARARRRDQTVV